MIIGWLGIFVVLFGVGYYVWQKRAVKDDARILRDRYGRFDR